jgi:hypothetical protein
VSTISHATSFALMTKSVLTKLSVSFIIHHEPVVYMTKTSSEPRFVKQNYRNDCSMHSHCGVACHIVKNCYKIHGYLPDFKFTQSKPI